MHPVTNKRSNRGFTIIELLVYIALTSMILVSVIVMAYPILSGAERLFEKVTAEIESAFVLRKIAWALSSAGAASIDTPALGASAETLKVTLPTATLVFTDDNAGTITLNGTPLTGSRVLFADFAVNYIDDTTDYLEITFTADGEPVGPYRRNLRY